MKIFTNPGSNLDARLIEHYGVLMGPQQITVDGVYHDTRKKIPLSEVDQWVQTAKRHPRVIGTTAAEFVQIFSEHELNEANILAVMSSRKLIHSYDSALDAAEVIKKNKKNSASRLIIFDSESTDVGAGLLVLLAAQALREGQNPDQIVRLLKVAAEQLQMILSLATLENMVKGGKAGALRVWFANMLNRRPLIGAVDGALKSLQSFPAKDDPVEHLFQYFERKFGRGRRLWLAISHGQQYEKAARLESLFRQNFDLHYCCQKPLSASIYLHAGPGSLLVAALPLDRLPWVPKAAPPEFF